MSGCKSVNKLNRIDRFVEHFRSKKIEYEMRFLMKNESISHISMFHSIADSNNSSIGQDECSKKDFIHYLDHCHQIGIRFISPDQLLTLNTEDAVMNNAVITFDDGYKSVWTIVKDELQERNIPFTCFITTSFIGQEEYITSEQLKELSDNELCTIGMHSDQHVLWRGKSKDELKTDYLRCREIITRVTGHEPQYFAFPYGSYAAVSKRNIDVIKEFSPKAIFLTDQRKLTKRDIRNPLSGLPRLDIPGYYKGYYKKAYMGLKLT